MIHELKKIGCDTARSVLALSQEELVRRTDLEEEHIEDIQNILRAEFEAEASSEDAVETKEENEADKEG
jgi:N utilization substance protein A